MVHTISTTSGTPPPVFSPDSQHLAFWAEKGDRQFVVLDGKAGPPYDQVDLTPVFSPDNQHLAYVATREDKQCIVMDGQEGPFYQRVRGLVFRPDSQRLAYRATIDGMERVHVGEIYHNAYLVASQVVFSPDGRYFVHYGSREAGRYHLVVNNRETPPYIDVLTIPWFSSPNTVNFVAVRHRTATAVEGAEERFSDIVRVTVTVTDASPEP